MFKRTILCLLLPFVSSSCGPRPPVKQTRNKRAQVPPLVVSIVLDQLPSEAFARYAPYLDKDGLIRRIMEEGQVYQRVRYPYAGTNTAPGHASIYTGQPPSVHGIDRNDLFDLAADKKIKIINDGVHSIFGKEDDFASPKRLLRPTVGDFLKEQNPESKVVSLSLKGRAAVVSGGREGDVVLWYEADQGGVSTSTFYGKELPPWVQKFNKEKPAKSYYRVWQPDDAKTLEDIHGPDDAPGEASWSGFGTTFPHDVAASEAPHKNFVLTPGSVDYILDLARTAVSELSLGRDDSPDLLAISISSTDYVGHAFSTFSWEYLDILQKTDRALARFIAELESRGEIAVMVTSDHGGTLLAQRNKHLGHAAGRLSSLDVVQGMESFLDERLGDGNWVKAYVQPYLYLDKDALESSKTQDVYELLNEYAEREEGIAGIYPSSIVQDWDDAPRSALEESVRLTVSPSSGDLLVVPEKWWVASPGSGTTTGTGHGTPWDYDREVPALLLAPGLAAKEHSEIVDQRQVAGSLASLLGLAWANAALPHVPKPRELVPREN